MYDNNTCPICHEPSDCLLWEPDDEDNDEFYCPDCGVSWSAHKDLQTKH